MVEKPGNRLLPVNWSRPLSKDETVVVLRVVMEVSMLVITVSMYFVAEVTRMVDVTSTTTVVVELSGNY